MPRNKYPEETVHKILDVSLKLFLEKGFEATTVLDIVNGLGGLTRGAFYHHFKSKEAVLDAIGDRMFDEANPFNFSDLDHNLNGLQKLKQVFKSQIENTDTQSFNEMALPALKNPRMLVEFLESNQKIIVPLIVSLLNEGIADGSIPPVNPVLIAELLMLLTNTWSIPSLFPHSDEEIIEKVILIKSIFDGLGLPLLDDSMIKSVAKVMGTTNQK